MFWVLLAFFCLNTLLLIHLVMSRIHAERRRVKETEILRILIENQYIPANRKVSIRGIEFEPEELKKLKIKDGNGLNSKESG